MAVELTLILLSVVLMIGLLIHKQRETVRGAYARVEEMRKKADPVVEKLGRDTGRFFSYVSLKNAVLLANFLFVSMVKFFMTASKKVHDSSSAIIDRASKKKEDLSRAGAASFYLKKIKEEKDSLESGATVE